MQPTDNTKQTPTAASQAANLAIPAADTKLPTDPAAHSPQLPGLPAVSAAEHDQRANLAVATIGNGPQAPPQAAQPPSSPLIEPPKVADDDDLIEQEWVDKAKAIVERTHDDPYQQNEELSKFKADYIKKRYNREIKVTEE